MNKNLLIVFSIFVLFIISFSALIQGETIQKGDIQTVDDIGDVGKYASIVLDANNYPHIVYYDSINNSFKYAKWNGNSWDVETVDKGIDVGAQSNTIILDSKGYPHISYLGFDNYALKYAEWDGGKWNIKIVDNNGKVGMHPSIALDSNDYPCIAYRDYTTSSDLKYAKWNGSSWNIEKVDTIGDVGGFPTLALDSNYYPHISYSNGVGNTLKYAKWNGSSWNIETVDKGGRGTSIVLNSKGYPHISHVVDVVGEIRYAKWNGNSWDVETVDINGNKDVSSIKLDSNSYPNIVYYDETTDEYNGDLKYAKWNGSSWNIETITSNVAWTSFALDKENNAHIVYYDTINKDLKYAKEIISEEEQPEEKPEENQSEEQPTKECKPKWQCISEPEICQSNGTQTKICKDTSCGMKPIKEEILCNESKEEKTMECNGCLYESKCLVYGHRIKLNNTSSYCSIEEIFKEQKEIGNECQNNYECLSNECSNSECISTYSLLQKIWNFLRTLFGAERIA